MEQLFNDIQSAIKDKLNDDVRLIDEDCGQLEALMNGEDRYPVDFPAVLIGTPETKWENLHAQSEQRGTMMMRVRLAIDCYNDTHYGSGTEEKAIERMRLNAALTKALHGQRFNGCERKLMRVSSRNYALPGGIKVYETEYTTTVSEILE